MTKLQIGGIYRHYKGNRYKLWAIAKHSETLEEMAVYQALYGEGELWVRPLSLFSNQVSVDGQWVERFQLIEE